MPEVQHHNDDPITSRSLSFPLLISSFVLLFTLAWALYDEMYGLRPWRGYQARFASAYASYLEKEIPKQREAETSIRQSPEFLKFEEQIKAAEQAAAPRIAQIDTESRLVDAQLAAISQIFQEFRAEVTAQVYQIEIASESAKEGRQRDLTRIKQRKVTIRIPAADGSVKPAEFNFDELESEFNRSKNRKAALLSERADLLRPAADLRKDRETFFQEKMAGLSGQQLEGLLNAAHKLRSGIRLRQINEENTAGLVDRCQSCHVAMDPALVPVGMKLTKADLGMEKSTDAPFTSHPMPELLKIHDPEKFGCSPCHGGNGRATSGVVKGHGRHKYWLWPLFYPENYEAGCQQCHSADMVTEHAPTLNRGRQLFRDKGCIGCHRYEGFDNQSEQSLSTRQNIRRLEQERRQTELDIPRVIQSADRAEDNKSAQALYAKADQMKVAISNIDAKLEQLNLLSRDLLREEKKVGPSLKEVRMKLRKEWIPVWLEKTHEFRPETRMPQFRIQSEEIRAIAAFIWQLGVRGPAPPAQGAGNSVRGKALVETRGCLGCHSIGEGNNRVGGNFAANLSRVGEKANYDYLVRWVHNPRERTRPYDPVAKKDLGPEDYEKYGKPFVFDLENSRSPDGKHELQIQQQTVMPSLRLTWEEARDIASYLVALKRPNARYEPADYMDDPALRDRGRALVKNFGCAGCHEIATLEDEGRIGTELTTEGSKPIERLDLALVTQKAERGILPDGQPSPRGKWYDIKGFVEQKLGRTNVYDDGKFTRTLRMPQPNVTPEDIRALATFVLGSVDQQMPISYMYRPNDPRKDVQEGWWLVTKYNCMGCHQLTPGQRSALQDLPQFAGENKDKLPPPLFGVGARVDPNWLAHFLENPALAKTDPGRNGVRGYLQLRMPTFSFSENEIRKLVRFFESAASQARPYLPPKVQPLTDAERAMARELFTHPAAPCLRCHATGDAGHDLNATAPNLLLARERLRPAWTARWITDPSMLIPGTAMPSGLFRKEGGRWVFAGPLPPSLKNYQGDHADLMVRYMFELTPQEQRALVGRTSRAPAAGGPGASGFRQQ